LKAFPSNLEPQLSKYSESYVWGILSQGLGDVKKWLEGGN
jgi:hypothetical protein